MRIFLILLLSTLALPTLAQLPDWSLFCRSGDGIAATYERIELYLSEHPMPLVNKYTLQIDGHGYSDGAYCAYTFEITSHNGNYFPTRTLHVPLFNYNQPILDVIEDCDECKFGM